MSPCTSHIKLTWKYDWIFGSQVNAIAWRDDLTQLSKSIKGIPGGRTINDYWVRAYSAKMNTILWGNLALARKQANCYRLVTFRVYILEDYTGIMIDVYNNLPSNLLDEGLINDLAWHLSWVRSHLLDRAGRYHLPMIERLSGEYFG